MEEVTSAQIFGEEPNIVEVTLAEFDRQVEVKKALDKLLNSPEYKLIIDTVYCTEEADRLKDWIINPVGNKSGYESRDKIVEALAGIGHFQYFMSNLVAVSDGIDDPAQRTELLKQLEAYEEQSDG